MSPLSAKFLRFNDMMKSAVYILLSFLFTALAFGQNAGSAGSFARMGYGARAMGMGNAASAVTSGEVSSYYNPALLPFASNHNASASFGILSLDRYLNYLNYTQPLAPRAGLSAGLINAGVRNIDGRNDDGIHTADYSTSENQFYLAFANRVDDRVSLGVSIKLYYANLYEKLTSTTVGFDAGTLISLTNELSLGVAVLDIGSKYKWDSKDLYGDKSKQTEDKFPMLRRIALAYRLPDSIGVVDAEFENSSEKTNIIRFGAEYNISPNFSLRAGLDRWDLSDNATGVKPSFGFTVRNSFNDWTPSLHYAFIIEGYSPHGIHMITLTGTF
jgi:long-subunit fatty acid transport protein